MEKKCHYQLYIVRGAEKFFESLFKLVDAEKTYKNWDTTTYENWYPANKENMKWLVGKQKVNSKKAINFDASVIHYEFDLPNDKAVTSNFEALCKHLGENPKLQKKFGPKLFLLNKIK